MLELVRFFIALVKRPKGKKLVKRTWKLEKKKNINTERQTTVLINIT